MTEKVEIGTSGQQICASGNFRMRDLDQVIKNLLDAGRLRVNLETGDVFSPRSNIPDKPLGAITAKGYLRTTIHLPDKNRVSIMLHRVVWIAARGIPPAGSQIDHGCLGKLNNRLTNLDAVSGAENMRRAVRDGLTNGGWRNAPRNPKTGRFVGKKAAGRLLDGRTHDGFPT